MQQDASSAENTPGTGAGIDVNAETGPGFGPGVDSDSAAGDTDDSPGPGPGVAPRRGARASRGAGGGAGTYAVLACVAALTALTMLGGLLNVGDHLFSAAPVLGWAFYALIAALVVAGVVVPVVKVSRRPVFSLYRLRDEQGHAKRRYCRMLVDNLVENTDVTPEEAARLEEALERGDEANDLLIAYFHERVCPAIDAETKRAAATAFFVSAVARSPLVSTVTMLSLCLDLVRAIVERCGFRPTGLGLARLYTRVMLSALVVGGIEDSDLQDLLGQALGGGAGARAGGVVVGSAAEGMVSAFLVFRVGVITKRWLTSEDGPAQMRSIRRTSYREALAMMRSSGFAAYVAGAAKDIGASVASSAATAAGHAARSAADGAASAAKAAAEGAVKAAAAVTGGAAAVARAAAETAAGAASGLAQAHAQHTRRRRKL